MINSHGFRASRTGAAFLAVVALLLTLVAMIAAAGQAQARVPATPKGLPAAIESQWTPYVPQRGCDPTWKRGTREFVALLKHAYPSVYSQGEYRCGTDGTVSEHYEGRAIDWMASARNARTRREANDLIHWLLATDRAGNRYAMARRLGVMYLIWNNRMWGSWDGRWQQYNGCAAKRMQKPMFDNVCHRTHVHISLTWDGATGRTTFWTGHVHATDYGICRKGGRYRGFRATPCPPVKRK